MLLGSFGDKAAHLFLGCLKLLGDCCIVADHLFLRCLKLLGDCRIVAAHLFLAGLKLLDAGLERLDLLLNGGKETARYRLEQLFLPGRPALRGDRAFRGCGDRAFRG